MQSQPKQGQAPQQNQTLSKSGTPPDSLTNKRKQNPNLDLTFFPNASSNPKETVSTTPYAYVALLYGNNEYFLGALMLGYCLSKIESKYDKVLLVTDDVPDNQVNLLRKYFKIKKVPYIHVNINNFSDYQSTIYKEIFTKFNLFTLTEYKKVLFLDIDMLVLKNMDHLFELNAPAAMLRTDYKHGERCASDFIKIVKNPRTGINMVRNGVNAGLMLLEPNANELNEMLKELETPTDYKLDCPEQDYLSFRYRDRWTHIDCKYNYQFSLPVIVERNNYTLHDLYNVHFSWYINPWEFLFENKEKAIFIIENVGKYTTFTFTPDTSYFVIWEQSFRALERILKKEGIDVLSLVKKTGMRDELINKYYTICKTGQLKLTEKSKSMTP